MGEDAPNVDWRSFPTNWFEPGVLPEERRQDLLRRLPRNWYAKGTLPEEHQVALLRDFFAEGARRAEEFFRIDPHEWRLRPREERERIILEGFGNLRKAIGFFGRRKRDYWDKYLYLEPIVEVELGVFALEVSEIAYTATRPHLLPITAEASGDLDRHNFEWQEMFLAPKELLRTKANHLSAHDRLYRRFIIGDRLKNFCLRYLGDRGWDERFIATVNSYLIELIAKAATSPPDSPLPE
jgi:hypothetical protein